MISVISNHRVPLTPVHRIFKNEASGVIFIVHSGDGVTVVLHDNVVQAIISQLPLTGKPLSERAFHIWLHGDDLHCSETPPEWSDFKPGSLSDFIASDPNHASPSN